MEYSFQNVDIYKSQFAENSLATIIPLYLNMNLEYLLQFIDCITIHHSLFYKYIFLKGLNTLNHLFRILLNYTKNPPFTYYHCQKAIYYYIEFINQIVYNNTDDLKLTSQNAVLFVYKQTIFQLAPQPPPSEGVNATQKINNFLTIYSIIIERLTQAYTFRSDRKQWPLKDLIDLHTDKLIPALMRLNISTTPPENKLEIVLQFIQQLPLDNLISLSYIELYIQNIYKKNIVPRKTCHEKLALLTPVRYINWLFAI